MSATILYVSSLCATDAERKLLAYHPEGVALQIQKYHRLLAQGLVQSGAIVQTLSFHRGLWSDGIAAAMDELENGVAYHYLALDHCGRFSHFQVLKKSYAYAKRFFREHPQSIMLCDVLNFSVSLGAALATRKTRRPILGIITDFPEQLAGKKGVFSFLIWRLIRLCTAHILLTEPMRDFIGLRKPSIILEGHADKEMMERMHAPFSAEEKKVIYAGSLHKKYGIGNLCEAFLAIAKENEVLHFYGSGDYMQEIRDISAANPGVIYHGVCPNEEIVEEELCAALLVNPRPTEEEYTKYSFPSKTMEYMASGTPVAMTRLPGMPEEYCDYVYLFDDSSVESIAKKLREILDKPPEELEAFGARAKRFVMENKTNVKQAEKILRFIEEKL